MRGGQKKHHAVDASYTSLDTDDDGAKKSYYDPGATDPRYATALRFHTSGRSLILTNLMCSRSTHTMDTWWNPVSNPRSSGPELKYLVRGKVSRKSQNFDRRSR
ncbi:hypothetical protein AVEN_253901-1 [Araneus ventricosus]|uniref:Uncharacterized protein n=1 Tax=Araneus ventricosus TaxID=182803 RepID=A0A4Y2LX39_ARAVE|nr:hypothetical protein AVEN_253901-1 [Araneus ventricosus]